MDVEKNKKGEIKMENVYETKIDELGRVALKKEMLKQIGVQCGGKLEISMISNEIILTPYQPQCAICGGKFANKEIGTVTLCDFCIMAIENDELNNSWNVKFKQMTRTIDEIGRVTLPVEYRNQLALSANDEVVLTVEEGSIYIKPSSKIKCFACGSTDNIYQSGKYYFCADCMNKIRKFAKEK